MILTASFEKLISKKLTLLTGFLLFVICEILFMVLLTPLFSASSQGEQIIDLIYLYNADQIIASIFKYAPESFRIHFYIRLVDSVFPAAYMLFFSSAIFLLTRSIAKNTKFKLILKLNKIYILPVAGAFFDYMENFFIIAMISSFPDVAPLTAKVSGILSFLKFSCIGLSMMYITFLLLFKFIQFLFLMKKNRV